jgi:UDP-N-acetylglucosamine 4,6-dehydratase
VSYELDGKSILITGGTGSFGQMFVSRLLETHDPMRIVVFSRDELKQFEMAERIDAQNVRYILGDVRDKDRVRRAFDGIDIVVHAAALKQVPAAEYNPIECIRTNVLGAENVINAAVDAGVDRVIAVSTDKAANPINLYGATKLCADKLFIAANVLAGGESTNFSVVRYGNVVGSRGSVIPFFVQRRRAGRTIPITDVRMTRFWITLGQGVDFVLRALQMMRRGEVFVPKLPSMRMVDLATTVAPGCQQEVIGIRPGEKLNEVLVPADEAPHTLEFDDFYVIQPAFHESWGLKLFDSYGGEQGRQVPLDFEYRTDTNPWWMTPADLSDAIGDVC